MSSGTAPWGPAVTAPDEADVPEAADAPVPLTVVIPLFNGSASIGETLDSVGRQTLPGIEVIVVDDGSDDDGVSTAARHPVGACVLRQEHLGVAVARNRGLAAAKGQRVAFLDQDDLWHPEHAARSVSWLDAHPEHPILMAGEIAFSASDEVDELSKGDPLVGSWASIHVPRTGALDHLVTRADTTGSNEVTLHDGTAMLRGPISVTTSFVADPSVLRLAGGFAPHALAMDDYWLLVNVARLHPIARRDQPTVFYRVHVGATSRSTRLGLPFLSSAAALRLGGGLISERDALSSTSTGDLHEHLLGELLSSPGYRDARFRAVVDDLADILWPDGGRRAQRRRALWAARLPWLRALRARLRGVRS